MFLLILYNLVMTISLIAAFYISCTNCLASGYVNVPCARCNGTGEVLKPYPGLNSTSSIALKQPCGSCFKGLAKPGQKGTGKTRKACPICRGSKRVKVAQNVEQKSLTQAK